MDNSQNATITSGSKFNFTLKEVAAFIVFIVGLSWSILQFFSRPPDLEKVDKSISKIEDDIGDIRQQLGRVEGAIDQMNRDR